MPFRQWLRLAAAIMASALAGCMAVSVALAPTPVTLATGTPGGTERVNDFDTSGVVI